MSEEQPRKRNLGRGLSALLGDGGEDLDRVRSARTVPIGQLRPSPYQPRHHFDDEDMAALVQSVKELGVLQPILVRRRKDEPEAYEIVAGERRWRAAQKAQLHEVPIILKDIADSSVLEIALVENVQREDLSPLEEAEGYRRLMNEFGHTQEDLARIVGKSRSHIANTVRLLNLPDPVRELLDQGKITAGHARALFNARDPAALARKVVARGLNVRQTERLVQRERAAPAGGRRERTATDADTMALEGELSLRLGLKVHIRHKGPGGDLVIRYESLEQLDDVIQRLSHGAKDPAV